MELYSVFFNNLYEKHLKKNEYMQSRLKDTENRLVVENRGSSWGGNDWEAGISRCKLLYIEWINNKVLLYSTGKYIQYPLINHNGKEYKKEHLYVYN